MIEISDEKIYESMARDNPWWHSTKNLPYKDFAKRGYYKHFKKLAKADIRRAVIMMGQRRIGKTVMLHQWIYELINKNISPKNIIYLSLDTPIYSGLPLQKLVDIFEENHIKKQKNCHIIFDEIQYLKNWGQELKVLVDRRPDIKFMASGSAAAELNRKSKESGAGRFTDFLLPPLNFAEFLELSGKKDKIFTSNNDYEFDINLLNDEFLNYINFGGYPEIALNKTLQQNTQQFVGKDILDKVLLKDLPTEYGISDVAELYRFFNMLAINSGEEISYSGLSKSSSINVEIIKKYLEFLEAAFLIKRIYKINEHAGRFKRVTHFKAYLTNPSMRAALFSPIPSLDSKEMGTMTETAIYSQFFQNDKLSNLHYSRWQKGEVDMVALNNQTSKPANAIEIKFTDRHVSRLSELKNLFYFAKKNKLDSVIATTRSKIHIDEYDNIEIKMIPSSYYTYFIGKLMMQSQKKILDFKVDILSAFNPEKQ